MAEGPEDPALNGSSISLVTRSIRGGASGLAATVAMSGVMLAARAAGLVGKLAPEQITEAGLSAVGLEGEEAKKVATPVTHLAYGTGAGAVFAMLPPSLPGPATVRGVVFATGLLLASYEGWVPAAGIMADLGDQTTGGRFTLVASHLVYGAVLGALVGDRPGSRGARDGGPTVPGQGRPSSGSRRPV